MYSTDELIEKYKAEMQKMISNSKPPEPKSIPTPAPMPATTPNPAPIKAPELNLKKEPEPTPMIKEEINEQFPKFIPDSEMLNQRIEEILAENSDVAAESDRPANLFRQSAQQNTEQGDLVFDGDELVSEFMDSLQNRPQSEQKPTIRPPIFTPQRPQMRPVNPQSQPSLIQPRQITQNAPQPPQPSPQTPPLINEQTENMQQMVSRTCIRGGQKAQYSPPANTGLALGINTGQTPPLDDMGTLRIETYTANRAIPIGDAVIRVKNEETNRLVAVFVTDSSGNTQSFTLPTPDRALSETPDAVHPFVNYLVDINAEGFTPQTNLPVQMFGGTESVLPANLIPLNT